MAKRGRARETAARVFGWRPAMPAIRSIRARMAIGAGALVAVAVVATGVSSWVVARGQLHREARERLTTEARVRAEAVHRFSDEWVERVSAVSTATAVERLLADRARGRTGPEFDAAAAMVISDLREAGVEPAWITDADGVLVAAADGLDPGTDLAGTHVFRQGRLGPTIEFGRSDFFLGDLVAAAPVTRAGELLGVIVARMPSAELRPLLEEGPEGRAAADIRLGELDDGRVRYGNVPGDRVLDPAEAPAMFAAIAGGRGFVHLKEEGRSVLAGFAPVGDSGWGLVVRVDATEAYGPIRQLQGVVVAVGGLVLALAVGTAVAFASRISRPIIQLTRVARGIADGEEGVMHPPIRTRDELEDLDRALRAMAEALRGQRDDAQLRFLAMSENAPIGVVVANHEGQITYMNPACTEMFGWSPDEREGQPLTRLMPVRYRDAHRNGFARYLQSGQGPLIGRTTELTGLRPDGSEFPLELSLSAWRSARGDAKFAAVVRDVSAQKQMVSDLVKARMGAEEASRAKSAFLANMSHEIRTPMNGILGMTELLLDLELTAQQREYVETVRGSAEALLALLSDILDLSRIEAGRLELESVQFQLRRSLEDTLQAMAVSATAKGLELVVDIGTDVPEGLIGDPVRLRQVVLNLVGNAVKFTNSGEVVLRIQAASLTSETARIRFEVSDTGPGIPTADQERIFKAFEQGTLAVRTARSGVGLGLTISNELVAMMGGALELESTPGEGSRFAFTVSFGRSGEDALAPPPQVQGMRILVVDDNRTNREVLVGALAGHGAVVVALGSAVEALGALTEAARRGEPFAVALIDARMPDVDGPELARRVRAVPELADLRIILLSSAGDGDEVSRARSAGIDRVLTKPVRYRELLLALPGGPEAEAKSVPRAPPVARPLRVLVAEDDAVNRMAARLLLERRGHRPTMVEDGRAAVDAVEREAFDVVLMDVRMPELDGLEATRQIRAREALLGGHVPIVAMTGFAMSGDRERCLEAGMDDYVSKPVRAAELYRAVERAVADGIEAPPSEMAASRDAIDLDAALERAGGDRQTLMRVVDVFLGAADGYLDALDDAVDAGDAAAVAAAAHRVKGALAVVGAVDAARTALRLEQMGRSGSLDHSGDALDTLRGQVAEIVDALGALLAPA